MISERGYDTGKYWHRDPSKMINRTEITRFPHAVLEIKLELKGGNLVPPRWVTDLQQNSGMLYEVHKFSKYILSFEQASIEHGGDGAFYVYLRKNKN